MHYFELGNLKYQKNTSHSLLSLFSLISVTNYFFSTYFYVLQLLTHNIYFYQLMQKWVLILLFAISLNAFEITQISNEIQPAAPARLPSFIGTGYHALKGNPYTNKVDQGFRSPILALTYKNGETTDDGMFLIPDFTTSTQSISCNMNSKFKAFSGTDSYQKELSNMAAFDTKFDALVMSAKFSFSLAFESISKGSLSKNMTSLQTNAECTVYTLEMPIYTNQMELSKDFIQGVKESYESNSWDDFLEHFGSHYTTSVTFGGRYFLEHSYTEQSMSLFKSLKIDLSVAAQAQFFMAASISMSDELKKYSSQTKVVNSKVETTTIATVGGLPPSSGNWVDWVSSVKNNLAPVSYKFAAITNMFNFVPGIDAAKAIQSFTSYFNSYCGRNVCPPLTPDRPDPRPLKAVFSKGPEINGTYQEPVRFDTNDGQITVGMRISRVLLGMGANFESVQFILSDGIAEHALPRVGTTALSRQYTVPGDDQIKCIRFGVHITTRLRFSSVQFITKNGVESEVFKSSGAVTEYRVACIQTTEQHIVGLYGSFFASAHTFDSIGLNFMKEVLPDL